MPSTAARQGLPTGRRLSCGEKHSENDTRLDEPLCPECYDYTGAVLFNARADLWRRFTIALRRTLARQAGLTNKALTAQFRVSSPQGSRIPAAWSSFTSTPSSASMRPAGPGTAPPAWADLARLTAAIDQAARAVDVTTPPRARAPGAHPGLGPGTQRATPSPRPEN